MKQETPAKVEVTVEIGAVKIHGPNSHLPEGTREELETEGPKLTEITYSQAVQMFGEEKATEMFEGVPEEDR